MKTVYLLWRYDEQVDDFELLFSSTDHAECYDALLEYEENNIDCVELSITKAKTSPTRERGRERE